MRDERRRMMLSLSENVDGLLLVAAVQRGVAGKRCHLTSNGIRGRESCESKSLWRF